ncbi:MAG: hypothetical protein AAB853_03165, partial [Patescibacteria group bacterium]
TIYFFFGLENRAAIFAVQALLTLASAIVLTSELRRIAPQSAPDMALLLLLLLPSVLHTVFSAYRENFALTLAMLFAAIMLRLQRAPSLPLAIGAGALLGALVLTYIPFLFFPLFLLLGILFLKPWRFFRLHTFILVLSAYSVISLWGIRNLLQTGTFQIAGSERSAIVFHVRGEQAKHLRGITPLRCLLAEYITRDWTGLPRECSYNAVMHALEERADYPAERKAIARAGAENILRNFPHYLWFSLFEILELHLPFVNGWGFAYNALAALSMVILYGGSLFSLPHIFRREYGIFIAFILYSTLIYTATDATPRYLLPIVFCYSVFAAVGYARLLPRSSASL